jgi:hypothetical protein
MKKRIAFDLHGVLNEVSEQIKPILEILVKSGNEIFIMSGPSKETIREELHELGIEERTHYTQIASVVDYLKSVGTKMWQDVDNYWWCSDKEWWESKGKMCKDLKIDVIFDNSRKYEPNIPEGTKFVLFKREE